MNENVMTARRTDTASAKQLPERKVQCVIYGVDAATVKRLNAPNLHDVACHIRVSDQPSEPVKRPPSSRTIARLREKAEAEARAAAAAQALARQVQPGLRPPPGRLFAVDVAGLVLRGPRGGVGSTERMVRTLVPLAAGGRHPAAVLMEAGGWADEAALREALAALAPKLNVIGVRVCSRKAGLRMAKLRPAAPRPTAAR